LILDLPPRSTGAHHRLDRARIERDVSNPGPSSYFSLLVGLLIEQIVDRSEEHTSELQSLTNLVCRLLLKKKQRSTSRPSGRTETAYSGSRRMRSERVVPVSGRRLPATRVAGDAERGRHTRAYRRQLPP